MIINRILAIIFMFWPYAFILCSLPQDADVASSLLVIYIIVTVIVYAISILNAFFYRGKNKIYELALFDMFLKLMHIPFYILIFFVAVISAVMAVVPALVMVAPLMIILLFIIDVLLMLTSSMYGISALFKARKAGIISKGFLIIHIILHCLFVTDVISAVIVFVKIKKSKKSMRKANQFT